MIHDTTEKDGNIKKSLPQFVDINVRALHHALMYLRGLLFTIQFAQTALVIRSCIVLKDIDASGKSFNEPSCTSGSV